MKGVTMTHSSPSYSRRLALTLTYVLLIFGIVSNAASTAHAQRRAYVASIGNTVSVIDTTSNTVIASIQAPSPIGIAITPDATKVYVTSEFSNKVSVIDTATNLVTAEIPVGFEPVDLAITPDGTRAYVVNLFGRRISVIDTATDTVIQTLFTGTPSDITITPDGSRAYVNLNDAGHSDVVVFDPSTNTGLARIMLCCASFHLAASPDGKLVYVTREGGISVIDTTTNTVIDNIPITSPRGVAFTPDGSRAYVTTLDGPGPNNVAVIDTATKAVIASVVVGFVPLGVATTFDSKRAYVTNFDSDTVSVIDTATNLVIATIPVGSGPIGIAITPALAPMNKDECKDGGYKNFGPPAGLFKNQGQCIKSVLE
jgi:YVTN family beta-propeller protein